MTVVDTRAINLRSRNLVITASLSFDDMRPCSKPILYFASSPLLNDS